MKLVKEEGLDALLVAARRLLEIDPDRFGIVLKLCRGYVAAYDRPDEPEEIFSSRLAELTLQKPKAQA